MRRMRRTGKSLTNAAVGLVLVAASVSPLFSQDWGPTDPAHPAINQGPKDGATASKGMVSTQLASSTLAALEVLKNGGNAVDAALTALFVQQVHDYHMVFLFGSMSALYFDAKSGEIHAINAVAQRPDGHRDGGGDATKVAIGGTVRGAWELHQRFGTRPWTSYFGPAIRAAEEGAIVTSFMYGLNFALFEVGMLGDLRDHNDARRFYMPDGHLVGAGNRWKMPALAQTLESIASDPHHMYTGEWGKQFVEQVQESGGKISLDDMAEYRAQWTPATRFTYRGHVLYGSPPPDTGGLEVGYNLNLLENFDLASLGRHWESAEALEIMARVFSRVEHEIGVSVRDPLNFQVPEKLFLDKSYGAMGAEYVRQTMPRVDLGPPADEATGSGVTESSGGRIELGSDHLVVVDQHGNWLTMLHTIHGGSPGIFIEGVRATGSEAAGGIAGPGRRLVLPITAIMITKDDKPWLAMGTPGNPPQPVTQVLVNILDHGMDPREAADAPRFWAFRGEGAAEKDVIEIESRVDDSVEAALEARGIVLDRIGDYNFHTGSMQIVWRDAQGILHGVTDARRLGYTAGHD